MEDKDAKVLEIRSEPVNISPEMIVASLTLGGSTVKWPSPALTIWPHRPGPSCLMAYHGDGYPHRSIC